MLTVQMTKFDLTESSYQILLVIMLHIWNFRYSKHVWIIKCVGFKSIIFTINLDFESSSKVFNIFIMYFYGLYC